MDKSQYERNEKKMSDEYLHKPYHQLFGNLRLNEIVRLLIAEWHTFNPYCEQTMPHTYVERLQGRLDAWNTLFGGDVDINEVLGKLLLEFAVTKDDRDLVQKTLMSCLNLRVISSKQYKALVSAMERKP